MDWMGRIYLLKESGSSIDSRSVPVNYRHNAGSRDDAHVPELPEHPQKHRLRVDRVVESGEPRLRRTRDDVVVRVEYVVRVTPCDDVPVAVRFQSMLGDDTIPQSLLSVDDLMLRKARRRFAARHVDERPQKVSLGSGGTTYTDNVLPQLLAVWFAPGVIALEDWYRELTGAIDDLRKFTVHSLHLYPPIRAGIAPECRQCECWHITTDTWAFQPSALGSHASLAARDFYSLGCIQPPCHSHSREKRCQRHQI